MVAETDPPDTTDDDTEADPTLTQRMETMENTLNDLKAMLAEMRLPRHSVAGSTHSDETAEDEDEEDRVPSQTPTVAKGIPTAQRSFFAKAVGKLDTLDIKGGVKVLFWLSQFESVAKASSIPVACLHILARTHVPPEAAQFVQNVNSWRAFKRALRTRYCPDSAILQYALGTQPGCIDLHQPTRQHERSVPFVPHSGHGGAD